MAMFLAFDGSKAIGFSHVFIRHEWFWTESQDGPVGYLEIIYVSPVPIVRYNIRDFATEEDMIRARNQAVDNRIAIMQAHTPELYLAWMKSLGSEWIRLHTS